MIVYSLQQPPESPPPPSSPLHQAPLQDFTVTSCKYCDITDVYIGQLAIIICARTITTYQGRRKENHCGEAQGACVCVCVGGGGGGGTCTTPQAGLL